MSDHVRDPPRTLQGIFLPHKSPQNIQLWFVVAIMLIYIYSNSYNAITDTATIGMALHSIKPTASQIPSSHHAPSSGVLSPGYSRMRRLWLLRRTDLKSRTSQPGSFTTWALKRQGPFKYGLFGVHLFRGVDVRCSPSTLIEKKQLLKPLHHKMKSLRFDPSIVWYY